MQIDFSHIDGRIPLAKRERIRACVTNSRMLGWNDGAIFMFFKLGARGVRLWEATLNSERQTNELLRK